MPLLKASSIARRSSPGANSVLSDERFCCLMIKSFKTGILLIDDQACTVFRRYNNSVVNVITGAWTFQGLWDRRSSNK